MNEPQVFKVKYAEGDNTMNEPQVFKVKYAEGDNTMNEPQVFKAKYAEGDNTMNEAVKAVEMFRACINDGGMIDAVTNSDAMKAFLMKYPDAEGTKLECLFVGFMLGACDG